MTPLAADLPALLLADWAGDNFADKGRPVPPPGVPVSQEARAGLSAEVARLGMAIDTARAGLACKPALTYLIRRESVRFRPCQWLTASLSFRRPTHSVLVFTGASRSGRGERLLASYRENDTQPAAGWVVLAIRAPERIGPCPMAMPRPI